MDRKKGVLNISVSVILKLSITVVNILARRFLIQYIGNEINGLNSLYLSILDFLSVAELGVGSAIAYCMYKPIVDGDENKVSALYGLFNKLYFIIAGVILIGGCVIMPLLPILAKQYQTVNVNLYLTFGLMLISVVLSYVYSPKMSLINAYKNNYITTMISSLGLLLQCAIQIAVLAFTRSFVWFIVCRIAIVLLQWLATEIIARKKYGKIIKNKQKIDDFTKKEVTKNVKAMFMHRIGGVLVNTADSIIISAFIGIVVLGKYSNYTTIVVAMNSVLVLFFSPLTSVIGHMCVEEDKSAIRKYYNFFYLFNFVLGVIFYLGYFAVIDNLVTICFGGGLEMAKAVSFVITVNYFIQFMRQATLLFRDATGTFYNDRWKPLLEGLVNIGLSIGFVFLFDYLWGEEFAVVGVIAATILTNLLICHIVEPHVLFKYALKAPAKKHYIRNYICIAVFIALLFALRFIMVELDSEWAEMFANGGISLALSFALSAAVIFFNKDSRHFAKIYFDKALKKLHIRTDKGNAPTADEQASETETQSSEQENKQDNEAV